MTAPHEAGRAVDLVLRGTVLTLDAVGTRARGVAVRRGVVVALDEDALDAIIGAALPPDLARAIAGGCVNPKTHVIFPASLVFPSASHAPTRARTRD